MALKAHTEKREILIFVIQVPISRAQKRDSLKKKNPREGKKLKTPNSVEMKTEKQQNKASSWKR